MLNFFQPRQCHWTVFETAAALKGAILGEVPEVAWRLRAFDDAPFAMHARSQESFRLAAIFETLGADPLAFELGLRNICGHRLSRGEERPL